MALTRGFSPAQFRDAVLGTIGPVPVSVTIASTAAGATSQVSGVSVPGVQPGDVLFVIPAVNPTAGCIIDASVTAANTVTVYTAVATGGSTYNPAGAQILTFVGFRFKTA